MPIILQSGPTDYLQIKRASMTRAFLPLLFVVQFFTWIGMFTLWIFALPLITTLPNMHGTSPIRWVGFCFALYVTLAAVINLGLPVLTDRFGKSRTHGLFLLVAAVSLLALSRTQSHFGLLLCFAGIGIGWASISSTPYTLVTDQVSDGRYSRAMAIFNFSTVIPQVVVALSMGIMVDSFAPDTAIAAGGAAMAMAGLMALLLRPLVSEPDQQPAQ
jgi:maltose/moltooligosaccharide transporter